MLARILVPEGARAVKVGEAIALLSRHGEEFPSHSAALGASGGQAESSSRAAASDAQPVMAGVQSREASTVSRVNNRRIKASPIARRLARQHGVDLSQLRGSGPGARIVKSDVEQATSRAGLRAVAASASVTPATSNAERAADVPHEVVKLSSMRRAIARRLSESKAAIPHFYLTVEIRVDSLLKLRSELNDVLDVKISVNDMLIRALGIALQRVPDANVQYAGEQLYKFRRADVSVAVAIPGGLVTPVVRDCAAKPASAIASEMKALVERARAGKLLMAS